MRIDITLQHAHPSLCEKIYEHDKEQNETVSMWEHTEKGWRLGPSTIYKQSFGRNRSVPAYSVPELCAMLDLNLDGKHLFITRTPDDTCGSAYIAALPESEAFDAAEPPNAKAENLADAIALVVIDQLTPKSLLIT